MGINDKSDPFAAVGRAVSEGGAAPTENGPAPKSKAASGEWVPAVPDDAPAPRPSHNGHGKPSAVWAYRDSAGRVIHYVCRFDNADGGKEILPQTLWREGRVLVWRWKAAPAPRPLYGLDRLAAAQPAAPVLLVEGEKTADAAAKLLPAFVAMTWSGGSKATGKADWAALAGRRVVILPDADTPGREAAEAALAAGASAAAVVQLPADLPQGWDCADAFPSGFALADLQERVAAALVAASAGEMKLPHGFRLDGNGLWRHESGRDGGAGHDVRLSAPFEVLGEARDPEGGGWAVLIRFADRDGREKVVTVKRGQLASEAGAVRAALASAGLYVNFVRRCADRFAAFLAEVAHSARFTIADRTGWLDASRFVLPAQVIAGPDAEPVRFDGDASAFHYAQAGQLSVWQERIALPAIRNRLLLFAVSLAFVGPVMRWLLPEGGGFHLCGASSTGKTSLALAAGSVWGGGGQLGFGHTWRATGNALEGVAHGHSETLLILDELKQVEPHEAGAAAYALATGQGKGRSRQDGALRRRNEWRVLLLSTGELTLTEHMASGPRKERAFTGQELRFLNLSADAGAGMGAWQCLHGADSAAVFSDNLKRAAGQHYGHAGPAFVRALVSDAEHWQAEAKRLHAAFMLKSKRDGDSGQIHRAALRFAAVAAAGEMAAAMGIVPWPVGAAAAAVLDCFDEWAKGFGRKGLREDRQVLVTLRDACQQSQARFAKVPSGKANAEWGDDDGASPADTSNREGEARALSTLGYVHIYEGVDYFLFHDAGVAEILKGFDLKSAVGALDKAGYLKYNPNRKKLKVRVGPTPQSLHAVRRSILNYDEDEEAEAAAVVVLRESAALDLDTPAGW